MYGACRSYEPHGTFGAYRAYGTAGARRAYGTGARTYSRRRATITGIRAACTTDELTEPSSIPANPPRP